MTQPSARRAAIYARISQADAEVDKTDRQEQELRELAARSGYEVVEVFVDDDVSAFEGKQARPGFVALLAAVNRGEVDVVMATEPQRFTRGSASELEALQVACTRVGAIIHTRAAGVQDPGTPMIRAMLQFQDTLAWLEVATARERQKVRHRGDRAKGIAKRGTRPFGFEVDGMTIRESEAVHIRDAFDSVLDRGATLWEVAQRWNALGVVTDGMGRQRRDRADPTAMKTVPAVWTTTTVRQVLTRPRNAGILTHEGAELPLSQIEPIVTREQLEALKAAIKGADSLKGPKPQYLLGGLLLCICGERMHATKSVTARKGKPKEERREYRIYRCRLYGFDRSQSHVTIAQKIAEEVVRDYIVENIGLGEDTAPAFDRERLDAITERLVELREQEGRATDALVEGVGDAARLRGRLKAITAERLTLSEQRDALLAESSHSAALGAYREQLQALPYLATDAQVDEVLAKGYAAWDALSMNDQRAIIRGGYRVAVRKGGRGHDRVEVKSR